MKKRLSIMGILFILATTIVFALNLNNGAPNREKNGFKRMYIENVFSNTKIAKFENKFRNICGFDSQHLYFDGKEYGQIFSADYELKTLRQYSLALPKIEKFVPSYYTTVFYPDVYLIGGKAKQGIKASLISKDYTTFKIDTIFNRAIMFEPGKVVFNSFNSKDYTNLFLSVDLLNNRPEHEIDIFGKEPFSSMKNDGQLRYDITTARFVFTSYYSNQFFCFDTTLKLLFKGRTIDTFDYSTGHIARKTKSVTFNAPPKFVNNETTCNNGILYVYSNLRADNEPKQHNDWKNVIDMYSLKDGHYLGSSYLPVYNQDPLAQIYAIGDKFIAVHKYSVTIQDIKNISKN